MRNLKFALVGLPQASPARTFWGAPAAVAFPLVFAGLVGCSGQIESMGGSPTNPGQPTPGNPTGDPGKTPTTPGGETPPGTTPPGTTGPGVTPTTPAPGTATACKPSGTVAGPRRLWLLNKAQYGATVATLFSGRSTAANSDLKPPDGVVLPFSYVNDNDHFSTTPRSYLLDEAVMRDAMAAGDAVSTKLSQQLAKSGCLAGTGDFTACMKELVTAKGELLFRRPLTTEEVDKYVGVANTALPLVNKDRARAAGQAFMALLMAPQFLYRTELGGDGALTAYEAAAAVSYALTDGPPDQALWDDARGGMLKDGAAIAKHVKRLMEAPQDRAPVKRFFHEYFRFGRATLVSKTGKPYVPATLVAETDLFIADTLKSSGHKAFFTTLLTSPVRFVSAETATNYGTNSSAKTPERVATANDGRAGLLSQPSWLAAFSQPEQNDPIRRGRFIRERLLCQPVPTAQIENLPQISKDTKRTLRDRLAEHRAEAKCKVCHDLMDPLGLAFEAFDHFGTPRTEEAGKKVDATGALTGTDDQDGPFDGAKGLMDRLGASKTVTACLVDNAFEAFLGRRPDASDECTLQSARESYEKSGGDLSALFESLLSSSSFLVRK